MCKHCKDENHTIPQLDLVPGLRLWQIRAML